MRIKISSRKSDLARIQAFAVGEALKQKHPNLIVEYHFRESLGDKNLNDPLWQMPEKGVFTQDFHEDLLQGQTDLVVHSWKDLPVLPNQGTEIIATLPRADMRDLLLVRKDRWEQVVRTGEICIFSSSPRRAYNLDSFLKLALPAKIKTLRFEPVRGNVPTRIQKLLSQQTDGLIVAKAALDRLLDVVGDEFSEMQKNLKRQLAQCHLMVLPLQQNPTAAAQGALAVEALSSRTDLKSLFSGIHCEKTFHEVAQEREILAGYGGGCHQKVGVSVLGRWYGEIISIKALTDQGETVNRLELHSSQKTLAKTEETKIFPRASEKFVWFDRERISVTHLPEGPLWIAKAEALPEELTPSIDTTVWASGWESWQKLSQRGVWITGCNESLGEDEDPRLESILGFLPWIKLTHLGAINISQKFIKAVLATYKLTPKSLHLDLKDRTHFFWSSGSQFLRVLELHPYIKNAHHSCGPGNTYSMLRKTLGENTDISVFLNYEQWKKQVT